MALDRMTIKRSGTFCATVRPMARFSMYRCLIQEAQVVKIFSIVILVLINSAVAQTATHEAGLATSSQEAKVTLCDLMAHPSDYAGKPVTVRATIASGMEFSIFTDNSCPPPPDKTKLVLAKFSSNQFQSPIGKKLTKLLKKEKQAEVTVVGVFNDPGHFIGHQNCCRYKLEVQQLLAVGETKAAFPDKHDGAVLDTVDPKIDANIGDFFGW
jgi:hypothetical protein